jgi:transcriptional regulator with XRE-family HTH domain
MTTDAAGSAPIQEFHQKLDWRRALREHRERRRLSQAEVAHRAGLSLASVRAYENGARHPTLEALSAMIAAIGLTPEEATPVRAGAGYAAELNYLIYGKYASRENEALAQEVGRYHWPAAVLNQIGDLLAANDALYAVFGPTLGAVLRDDPEARNLIALTTDPRFVPNVLNWDEVMTFIIGLTKGDVRTEHNLERPAPNTQVLMRRFLAGDPAYITRTLKLWESVPPLEHWTRHNYRFHWRGHDSRELRFRVVFHVADVWNELFWCDYVPEDAETWQTLGDYARPATS